MHPLAKLDLQYLWHPFTQMRDWLRREPIVIVEGRGAELYDIHGRAYLDGNSSIWTNLHGHNQPKLNQAVRSQLRKIAHSSALGLANEPASKLARELVRAANPASLKTRPRNRLERVFFSDDGSTAMEVALKLAFEHSRRSGLSDKPRFLAMQGAYHGDTLGAVSVGHIDLFHRTYSDLLFKTEKVSSPYCYRCPYNRARPERADARTYRKCNWECTAVLERKFKSRKKNQAPYAALVLEPLIQGAAGMIPQPTGWLNQTAAIAREYGALLIADEVLTGFGRAASDAGTLFACHQEHVQADFMTLAKGLTGGYLPMAATLTTQAVFNSFLGDYAEFKSFFHGHSYTSNQLGAATSLASLELLQSNKGATARKELASTMQKELHELWKLPTVGDIRQVGLIAGIELVKDWRTRQPFDLRERAGIRVCEAMARKGVLTRPIGNVIPLLPPYCTNSAQVRTMVRALGESVAELSSDRGHSR